MNQYKWASTMAWLFLLLSGIIIAVMMAELYLMKNYRAEKLADLFDVSGVDFSMQQAASYQVTQDDIEKYTDIVARPIFFKGRQAITIEESEIIDGQQNRPHTVIKIKQTLIGIINTPQGKYAVFQDPNAQNTQKKFIHVMQGEEIDGWRIKEIQSDRLTLTSGTETEEIRLAKPRTIGSAIKRNQNHVKSPLNPFELATRAMKK